MPRTVFKLLWETLRAGEEFFGYVKNLSKDGAYYWVYATVTPSYAINAETSQAEIIGFFSVRRKPDPAKLKRIQNVYRDILSAENQVGRGDGIAAGLAVLNRFLESTGKDYREFILTL
jgi:hypothetical protein